MRSTKKLTLSAILVAMSVVIMVLGGVISVLDLSMSALASLIVAFAYIEIGMPYTWLIWLATTVLSAVIFPGSLLWVSYFVAFGVYPILKGYIERLPRPYWILIKLLFANAAIWLMIAGSELILGLPLFDTDSLGLQLSPMAARLIKIGLYLFLNLVFFAYDLCITACVRFYMVKLRHRFQKFLR
jgi:hypothetical protein